MRAKCDDRRARCRGGRDRTGHQLDRKRGSRGLGRPQEVVIGGRLGVGQQSDARQARRDLLEQRQPLADDAGLERQETREIAAGPRQAGDEARADRVGDDDEHDRDRAGLALQCRGDRRRMGEDHVGLQGDQLFRERRQPICVAGRKASVDADIAAFRPSELVEPLPECREPRLSFPDRFRPSRMSTPMRRMRSGCCARAASGHAPPRRRAA